MANLVRSSSTRAVLRALSPFRLVLLLASAALMCAALLSAAAPAGAVVVPIEAGESVGLQPRSTVAPPDGNLASAATFANPSGNPVLHANKTYAIYWDPKDFYHGDWQHLIDTFFHGLGSESGALSTVFAVDAQYTDKSNTPASYASTFMGAYTDTNPYPAAGCTDPHAMASGDAITCITDRQIREELQTFISPHGLHKGMGSIFYVLTPPGVTVCLEPGATATACSSDPASSKSFCSYHSDINPTSPTGDESTILYAVIPWTAGGLGDYHLKAADQISGDECQDGGYDPSSKPIEKHEAAKEKNEAENIAFGKMDTEEKAKVTEQETREGPHQEEPNQPGSNGPDGSPDTGLADLIINQVAVEQQNTVTDPLLNAWQDTAKNEATDECRNFFATGELGGAVTAGELTGAGTLFNQTLNGGSYYLNDAFNMAALRLPYPAVPCLGGVNLAPQFTAPNPVKANEVVGFDGMESNISLVATSSFPVSGAPTETYATYTWNFGDGTSTVSGYAPGDPVCSAPWLSPCAGSAFHSYEYGGTYNVTLTVRDVGGNTASVTNAITVQGPPRPGSGAPGASGGSGSASAGGSTTSTPGTSTGGAAGSVPAPVATSSVLSRSLAGVLKSGLVVRYSVNEQVAGHFEVLLAASIARHLGLHGAAATGLPKGTAPQIVIAKAILITTRGGRNTVKILLPKSTAARLHRLHKVSLMVRLVVRNASPKSPASTTSVSTVTLTG